jgi:predicted nucleic acid-binding protein
VLARKTNEAEAEVFSTDFRRLPIQIVEADYARAEHAGGFRNRFSLPYADSFAASLAAEQSAKLLTADYDFKRVANAVEVEFLPVKKH